MSVLIVAQLVCDRCEEVYDASPKGNRHGARIGGDHAR